MTFWASTFKCFQTAPFLLGLGSASLSSLSSCLSQTSILSSSCSTFSSWGKLLFLPPQTSAHNVLSSYTLVPLLTWPLVLHNPPSNQTLTLSPLLLRALRHPLSHVLLGPVISPTAFLPRGCTLCFVQSYTTAS